MCIRDRLVPDRCQAWARATSFEGAQLGERTDPVGDLGGVRRLDEREVDDVAELGLGHLEDDGREVRPQDLGLGVLGARLVVGLAVEADADTGCDAAAPTRALVRGGLRDRLDGQQLDLRTLRVAGCLLYTS